MRIAGHFLTRGVTKSLSALFVTSLLLPSAGVVDGLVICLGPNGHVAVELPHTRSPERHQDEAPGVQGEHRSPRFMASAEMCGSCLDIPLPGLLGRERIVNPRAPEDHQDTPPDMGFCSAPQESKSSLSADRLLSTSRISSPHLYTLRTVILIS